jgi:hypothetical protein
MFEDIKAWQEARAPVRMVHEAVKTDNGCFTQYLLIKEQHPKNSRNPRN